MRRRLRLSVTAGTLIFGGLADAATKPNILFILADDLGYGDLACYGRADIRTPAIDSLARLGIRLTAATRTPAECTPSRAAFLTGRYQQRIGGLECAIGIGHTGRYDDAIRLCAQGELGLRSARRRSRAC
jgi:N-acetylgalactosamine-6-sulfatase